MITAQCNIWGQQFNPTRMLEQISSAVRVHHVTEPGQIGERGRFKGVPTPYGACTIMAPDNVAVSERISWMTDFISKHINTFRINGATDIVFHLEWEGVQGNMEFTPKELKGLADLQIPLTITYTYEAS